MEPTASLRTHPLSHVTHSDAAEVQEGGTPLESFLLRKDNKGHTNLKGRTLVIVGQGDSVVRILTKIDHLISSASGNLGADVFKMNGAVARAAGRFTVGQLSGALVGVRSALRSGAAADSVSAAVATRTRPTRPSALASSSAFPSAAAAASTPPALPGAPASSSASASAAAAASTPSALRGAPAPPRMGINWSDAGGWDDRDGPDKGRFAESRADAAHVMRQRREEGRAAMRNYIVLQIVERGAHSSQVDLGQNSLRTGQIVGILGPYL